MRTFAFERFFILLLIPLLVLIAILTGLSDDLDKILLPIHLMWQSALMYLVAVYFSYHNDITVDSLIE
jgi:hypothetical protein